MNYGKAKKILIFLFLFLNLFLICMLIFLSGGKNAINGDSVSKTAALLKKNNIEISERVIPKKVEILDFLDLYNPLSDFVVFKASFPNTEAKKEEGFTAKTDYLLKTDREKDVLKALNENGFKPYSLSFLRKEENPVTNEKKYYYGQKYNGYFINGTTLCAVVKNRTVTEVSGNLYQVVEVKYTDYETFSPLSVLLNLSADYKGKRIEITEITQQYFIPKESKSYKDLTAVPCFRIKMGNNYLYYDGITGTFLQLTAPNGVVVWDKAEAFKML